jgi:hypothetical protein
LLPLGPIQYDLTTILKKTLLLPSLPNHLRVAHEPLLLLHSDQWNSIEVRQGVMPLLLPELIQARFGLLRFN